MLLLSGDKLANYLIGLAIHFPDIYLSILDVTDFFLSVSAFMYCLFHYLKHAQYLNAEFCE